MEAFIHGGHRLFVSKLFNPFIFVFFMSLMPFTERQLFIESVYTHGYTANCVASFVELGLGLLVKSAMLTQGISVLVSKNNVVVTTIASPMSTCVLQVQI